ncbi:hypothetical protein ACFO4O_00835 [Glaciecola siphonariae]|uniref:Uncharacterized protein n=1 Tax=Glaciecola siphonariae TaxID=521012 RepID=A0ABV9LRF5_9ALTE
MSDKHSAQQNSEQAESHNKRGTNHEPYTSKANTPSLEALYQARKARVKSPAGVKSHFDNAASPTRYAFANMIESLSARIKTTATFAAVAVAILVISYHQYVPNSSYLVQANQPAMTAKYTSVQVHILDSEVAEPTSQRTFNYSKAKQDMLSQQASRIDYTQIARVVNFEESAQLVTCNEELIEISKQALTMLLSADKASSTAQPPTLLEGELMALTFSESGYILDIHRAVVGEQCG